MHEYNLTSKRILLISNNKLDLRLIFLQPGYMSTFLIENYYYLDMIVTFPLWTVVKEVGY